MTSINTPASSGLSGRLNQALGSVSFRAAGPFSLRAGDLVLDFTPAWDFRDINHRRLSLSGGYGSILRPAYVRVILSVSGAFHPACDEPNVWVIEDLGLLELGGSIDIDIAPEAEFRLVFVEPVGTSCEVPVDGGQSCRVTLPGSARGWSVSDRRFVIRADSEMSGMAYVAAAVAVSPVNALPVRRVSGRIEVSMVGGDVRREPVRISPLPLTDCPLGLVKLVVYGAGTLLERPILKQTLWPVLYSKNNRDTVECEIPASFVLPEGVPGGEWEAIPVAESELDGSDTGRLREILNGSEFYSSDFPAECRDRLAAALRKLSDEQAGRSR